MRLQVELDEFSVSASTLKLLNLACASSVRIMLPDSLDESAESQASHFLAIIGMTTKIANEKGLSTTVQTRTLSKDKDFRAHDMGGNEYSYPGPNPPVLSEEVPSLIARLSSEAA